MNLPEEDVLSACCDHTFKAFETLNKAKKDNYAIRTPTSSEKLMDALLGLRAWKIAVDIVTQRITAGGRENQDAEELSLFT